MDKPLSGMTQRIYQRMIADFRDFCDNGRLIYATPNYNVIHKYLQYRAPLCSKSTISVHVSAIAYMYRREGYEFQSRHPRITEVIGTNPRGPKRPRPIDIP